MAVIAFFSAKGAPGVTTTAMLCAALWPRPALLVDCDAAGGDIGLRLPDPQGRPLDAARGLLTLLPLARRELDPEVLLAHAQRVLGGGEVIVGLPGSEQATAVGPLWSILATAFVALTGYDVLLDLGRIDSRSPLLPLLRAADIGVCVITTSVSSVVSARNRLRSLTPECIGVDGRPGPLLGVVVQSGRDRRDVPGAVAALQNEDRLLDFFGEVATDPPAAEMFDGRPVSRPERTLLVRSGHQVVNALFARLPAATAPVDEFMPVLISPAGRTQQSAFVESSANTASANTMPSNTVNWQPPAPLTGTPARKHSAGRRRAKETPHDHSGN